MLPIKQMINGRSWVTCKRLSCHSQSRGLVGMTWYKSVGHSLVDWYVGMTWWLEILLATVEAAK